MPQLLYLLRRLLRLPLVLFVRLVLMVRAMFLFGVHNPVSFAVIVAVVSVGGYYVADERGAVPEIDTTDPGVVDPVGEAEYEANVNTTGDRDDDRLPNRAEALGETEGGAPLPDAHPYQKDLYVNVYYVNGASKLTQAEKRTLRETWRSMNVTNPDGTTGIRIHVLDSSPYGGSIDEDTSGFTNEMFRSEFDTEEYMEDRICVHHQSIFASNIRGSTGGWGSVPGYFSVIDGSDTTELEGGDNTVRTLSLTHEILHNVVGEVEGEHASGDPHHTTGNGYLASEQNIGQGMERELSNSVEKQLSEMGFRDDC